MSNKELLSEEEMSALLPDQTTAGQEKRQRAAVPYNFRRPDRLSKEQVRSLYLLHDTFAQNLSSNLPLYLRTISEVNLISVEQQSYADYLRGMTDPTIIFTVAADALKGVFAIEISAPIAFPIIDRMLGGDGLPVSENRAATDLELDILEGFMATVTKNYCDAWQPIIEFKTELTGCETRPQMLQIVSPNEVVAVINYQMQIGEAKGSLNVCLPVTMLETVIESFSQSSFSPARENSPETIGALLRTISNVRFPLIAELSQTPAMVSDLMALAVGDVLRTNHRVEKSVNVCVANSTKFRGRIAACDGKMIVQVTEARPKIASSQSA